MAELIIEVSGRHGAQYHKVDKPLVRIGRAYDNDVIIPDPTVSPHHLTLRLETDGQYILQPVADENGIRIGRALLEGPLPLTSLPVELDAGRTRIRIFDSRQPVQPTRLLSCRSGGPCLFGSPGWAIGLFLVAVLLSAIDNYLSTPQELSWESFWRDQVVLTFVVVGLTFGLLVLNRLTSHRWEPTSSLGFVSLVFAIALLIDIGMPYVDYFFSANWPSFVVAIAWSLVAMPVALGWFLIRYNHGNPSGSLIVVALLLAPGAWFQFRQFADYYDLYGDFSRAAHYNQTLVPGDRRLGPTIDVDAFRQRMLQSFATSRQAP
jgi:hypothetical protein